MRLSAIALAMAALALAGSQASAQTATPPVRVTGGAISGTEKDGVRSFLGVPFAAPPLANLRWRPPQPVVAWKGTKTATAFSPACAPNADWLPNVKSEDCLYLNVWAPKKARKLPVIVWIHGGAMDSGTAAVPVQNGANLARRGAIVVTINYRLGIFGFFSHPELSRESPQHVSGNQGILDQIAALRWVKANAAAFGGDPNRVTIMGCSSGGESVAVLVASPLTKGLFQRAVAESGNDAMPIDAQDAPRFNSRAVAESNGLAYAKAVGSEHVADLRKMSLADLKKQAWLPRVYVDGYVLTTDMTTTYRNHRQNDVPLLTGWAAEEGKDLIGFYLDPKDSTTAKRASQMTTLLGYAPSQAMLDAYPGATDAEAAASVIQFVNDWWGWRMQHWAALQARYGRAKSYVYYFAHRPTEPSGPCNWACGAGHGVEVQYLFDNLAVDPRNWSAEDKQLAGRLADTVVQFARTGKPTGDGLPAWQPFDGSNASILPIANDAELKAHPLPDFALFSQMPGR